MNCCANCFSDEQIKKIIVDNGHIGDCDFCGEKQVPVCSVDEATDISDLISDVLSVYEENERGRPLFSAIIEDCNGVQREHNKKLNNGLPILHKVPPKRDYGRYFCIMAEKGGTSHGGLTEKLSLFFHAKKQEVNAYGR